MSSERVLIIEDDTTLLRGLTDNFRARGFQVRAAGDGMHGLESALADPPDLVVLDIMLPAVNGFEVCQRMRERGLDMPIIMLTAKGQEEDVVRGLTLGADDYVTKPFSIRELLARAEAFLRRRRQATEESYRFGDYVLDPIAHRLLHRGREVPLTAKEYRLLEYFVRRPGRALARQDIVDNVWGRAAIITSRSVDRCVSTLRGKIEPDAGSPAFIQTIRDIGYRFEPEGRNAVPGGTGSGGEGA